MYKILYEATDKVPYLKIELKDPKLIFEDEAAYSEFTDELFKSILQIYEQTQTAGKKRLIEPEVKKLIRRPSIRLQMLEKCGKRAFLLPDAKPYPKFPVMKPIVNAKGEVEKCEYHCGLIVAAWYRANQWESKHPEYRKVEEEAYKLYKKLGCENHVPIHIHVETEIITPNETKKFGTLYEAFGYLFNLLIPQVKKMEK
jgi:hypothetical protein